MLRALALGLATAVSVAACQTQSVTLDEYRGAYSTHFGGIPDRTAVCARLHNRGAERVGWVRLRLRSTSTLGERPARLRSDWIYSGGIEPGETLSLAFADPPSAERIDLTLRSSGSGRPARGGRPLVRVATCSASALAFDLGRPPHPGKAAGVEVVHIPGPFGAGVVLADTR